MKLNRNIRDHYIGVAFTPEGKCLYTYLGYLSEDEVTDIDLEKCFLTPNWVYAAYISYSELESMIHEILANAQTHTVSEVHKAL